MWGKTIGFLVTGFLLAVSHSTLAEPLAPDPAWKQGILPNGLRWQILATPQRPNDRIEIRLSIGVGSLSENSLQTGYSHFLPRLALTQSSNLTAEQARSLWSQSFDPKQPIPVVVTSYNFTLFSLSLPNTRVDLVKDSLNWFAGTAQNLQISQQTITKALQSEDMVTQWPHNPKDSWWRYRLQGSNLIGHDPGAVLQQPIDIDALQAFYQKWYTADSMTLIIVGNVDARVLSEQIIKTFGKLQTKRETPAPLPALTALPTDPVGIFSRRISQNSLALIWDTPWQQIRDSDALMRYWREDLTREALFLHAQHRLQESALAKDTRLSFDCRVLYQRGQCVMNIKAPNDKLNTSLEYIAHWLANLSDKGISKEEFATLISQKQAQLQTLFTTYAHTNTQTLINQRLSSLQNQVVDIAPEQYQKWRTQFLDELTIEQLNQNLHRQLTRKITLVLFQPVDAPSYDLKQLGVLWDNIMYPATNSDNGVITPESAKSASPDGE